MSNNQKEVGGVRASEDVVIKCLRFNHRGQQVVIEFNPAVLVRAGGSVKVKSGDIPSGAEPIEARFSPFIGNFTMEGWPSKQ